MLIVFWPLFFIADEILEGRSSVTKIKGNVLIRIFLIQPSVARSGQMYIDTNFIHFKRTERPKFGNVVDSYESSE